MVAKLSAAARAAGERLRRAIFHDHRAVGSLLGVLLGVLPIADGYAHEFADDALIAEIHRTLEVSTIEISADRFARVKKQLDGLIARDPANYRAYTELSRYHFKNGYRATSEDFHEKYDGDSLTAAGLAADEAIRLNPTYADAYIQYGIYLAALTEFEKAEEYYAKAESLGSGDPRLYYEWGKLMLMLERRDDALGKLQRSVGLAGKDGRARAYAYEMIAYVHEFNRDYEQADDYYRNAVAAVPDNAWIKGTYAEFLRARRGDIDQAIAFGEEALRLANYGIGRRILALALYAKWGQMVIEHADAAATDEVLVRARDLYPELDKAFFTLATDDATSGLVGPLLAIGVSVDTTNEAGYTALNWAASEGEQRAVRALLALGADATIAGTDTWLPIYQAIESEDLEMLRLLLPYSRNISAKQYAAAQGLADQHGDPEIKAALENWWKRWL